MAITTQDGGTILSADERGEQNPLNRTSEFYKAIWAMERILPILSPQWTDQANQGEVPNDKNEDNA